MKVLEEIVHPFPELAVKRAMYASKAGLEGAGLSKIPMSIIEDMSPSKSEAKKYYTAIEDSIDVEASFLQQKDGEVMADFGEETALIYLYENVDPDTIINIDLGLDFTPEIPESLISADMPKMFDRIVIEIDDAFSDDFVRGMDRSDATRKGLKTKLKTLIEQIGELR